jgi:hypothetical protein
VLLLALGFLFFFGLIIPLMLGYATSSVLSSQRLRVQRNTTYAADGATDAAIQYARTAGARNAGVGAFGHQPCIFLPNGGSPVPFTVTINTVQVTVTCTSVADPTDFDRTVQFTASIAGTTGDPTMCTGFDPSVRLVAEVFFSDSTAGSGDSAVDVHKWQYCR